MDIEQISVMGLYSQNENKVPPLCCSLSIGLGEGNFAPLDIK